MNNQPRQEDDKPINFGDAMNRYYLQNTLHRVDINTGELLGTHPEEPGTNVVRENNICTEEDIGETFRGRYGRFSKFHIIPGTPEEVTTIIQPVIDLNNTKDDDLLTISEFLTSTTPKLIENTTEVQRRRILPNRPTRGNLGGMYIDPETGGVDYLADANWTHGNRTDIPENIIDNVPIPAADENWYYEQDGRRLPLTIDAQPDIADLHYHLTATINNFPNNTKTITNPDIVPKIDSPYKEKNDINQKQLTTNLITNNSATTNTMTLPYEPNLPQHRTRSGIVVIEPNDNIPRRKSPVRIAPQQPNPVPRIPEMPVLPAARVPPPRIPEMPVLPTAQATRVQPQILTNKEFTDGITNRNHNHRIYQAVRVRDQPVTFNPVANVVPEIKKVHVVPVVPEIKKAPVVLNKMMPLPTRNPYLLLPRPVLDAIATERDVNLTGGDSSRAEQLFELDNIMSDWVQSILTKNIENFQVLTGAKLYVFGALHGVLFNNIGRISNRDLMHYIRISILVTNPNHPGRTALPGILNDADRKLLEILSRQLGIKQDDLPFISTEDLKKTIITGKHDHIPMDTIITLGNRYRLLKDHKYKSQLADLYAIDAENDDSWLRIVHLNPHPMETVIIQLDSFDINDIISQFQMAIPLMYSNNIKQYIINNIASYAQILTRDKLDLFSLDQMKNMRLTETEHYLNKLTDMEIFTAFGIYVPYDNRSELIRKLIATIHVSGFLYPSSRSYERAYNHTTVGLSDINDTTVFMVAYGTALKYHVYELDDLRAAFTCNEETGAFVFRRPEAPNTKFDIGDVECLRQLLGCFPSTPEGTVLTQLIDTALIDARETTKFDEETRRQLVTFGKPIRDIIQQFLRQVFYIGMYMRRWQGPGHPFPLKTDDTKRKVADDELDALVKKQIEPAVTLLAQMGVAATNFCLQLRLCEYKQDGGIDIGNKRFEGEWHDVGKGKQCIRMASSKFVGTAYHYLRVLFRETIPGMDIKGVDRII